MDAYDVLQLLYSTTDPNRHEDQILLTWRPVSIGGGPEIETSISEAETARLCELAAGKDVLEIGSAFGYSAIVMAHAGANHVLAVDPHIWPMEQGKPLPVMRENLARYELEEKVSIVLNTSQATMPVLHQIGARFDLVFVDGDHRPEFVESDVRWGRKLLRAGGWLACHDYEEITCPGVRLALNKLFPGGPARRDDTLWQWQKPG